MNADRNSAPPAAAYTYLLPAILLSLLWCVFLAVLFQRSARNEDAHATALAELQARTLCGQMLDTRAWNAAHGGVYVRESDYGSANPWLPENMRRAALSSGEQLVLINPAYMSRQIADRSVAHGARLRITSRFPLRPENLADAWENAALLELTHGATEVFSLQQDDAGMKYFRYMSPLHAEKACLHCHVNNKLNDVRGGISVTLEAQPFLRVAQEGRSSLGYIYSVLGLTGMLGIGSLSFALRRRRSLADQKIRMKNAFLANMSHDMRTPLTGIIGMAELLQHEAAPENRRRACSYLRSAAGALLEMITDITAHAALDTGKLRCERKMFALKNCLEDCLELFKPGCMEKGLKLTLDIDRTLPPILIGDAFRLRQTFGNLIGNAVKFTEQGEVHVNVTGSREEDDILLLRIEVKDSGLGIPAHELDVIFEPFAQGAQSRMHDIPGTGLGLAISRELARLMGGTLSATSLLGQGSTFTLTLRCGIPTPETVKREDKRVTPPPPKTLRGTATASYRTDALRQNAATHAQELRIVLAEDNKAVAFFLHEVLKRAGHKVKTTRNGFDALALLPGFKADLAILDVQMPGLNGLETARRIRAGMDGIDPALPILCITATKSEDTCKKLKRCRVNAQTEKPISADLLLRTVQELCAAMPVNVSMSDKEQTGADAARLSKAHFDPEAALQAVDGDRALLLKLAAVLLKDLPEQQKALAEASANGDPEAVRRPAHALKNSSAMLRLNALHAACAALENAAVHGQDILSARLEVERILPETQKVLSAYLDSVTPS